jgi:hypothetical protein
MAYASIYSLAYKYVAPLVNQGCVMPDYVTGIKLINFLTTVIATLADCESSSNPACVGNNNPPDYGLYQIDQSQWARCGGSGQMCDPDQNTLVRIREIFAFCALNRVKHGTKQNLYYSLFRQMETFQGGPCRSKLDTMYPDLVAWLSNTGCSKSPNCALPGCQYDTAPQS